MKYQRKPIVVEAQQFTKDLAIACLIDKQPVPFDLSISGGFDSKLRRIYSASVRIRGGTPSICAQIGDWIVKDEHGEFHAVSPDAFAKQYEPVAPTDYRDRVRAEKAELEERVVKLGTFVASEQFSRLPEGERYRMDKQLTVMHEYLAVLHDRINNFTETV
jgi:hypothetical protein